MKLKLEDFSLAHTVNTGINGNQITFEMKIKAENRSL